MNKIFSYGGLSEQEVDLVFGGSEGVFPDEICHKKGKFIPLDECGCSCKSTCRNCFNLKFNQGFYCDA